MSPTDEAGAPEHDDASLAAVEALRTQLESIDDVPVGQRVAVFEAANATLTAALAALDEV